MVYMEHQETGVLIGPFTNSSHITENEECDYSLITD